MAPTAQAKASMRSWAEPVSRELLPVVSAVAGAAVRRRPVVVARVAMPMRSVRVRRVMAES